MNISTLTLLRRALRNTPQVCFLDAPQALPFLRDPALAYYSNGPSEGQRIYFTDNALAFQEDSRWVTLPYAEIATIEISAEKSARSLQLSTANHRYTLPITGGDGRFRDTFAVHRFLRSVAPAAEESHHVQTPASHGHEPFATWTALIQKLIPGASISQMDHDDTVQDLLIQVGEATILVQSKATTSFCVSLRSQTLHSAAFQVDSLERCFESLLLFVLGVRDERLQDELASIAGGEIQAGQPSTFRELVVHKGEGRVPRRAA